MGAPCFMLRTFFGGEGGRWFPNLPNPPAGPAAKRKRFARGSVCTVSFFRRLQQPDRSVFVRNRQEHGTLLRILVRSMQHKAERAVEAAEDHAVTAVLAEDRLRGRRPVPGNVAVFSAALRPCGVGGVEQDARFARRAVSGLFRSGRRTGFLRTGKFPPAFSP